MPELPTADLLIGIDVGTTGTKSMLVDANGTVVAQAYRGYPITRPRALVVEQDAGDWWAAVVHTVRECVAVTDARRVRAISISAQGGTLVAIDRHGDPLEPARSWLDRRAGSRVAQLEQRFGRQSFFERTGWRLFGAYNCVQLLDMRENNREVFDRASAFLGTADFLNARLTGVRTSDVNSAGITSLTNARAGDWDDDVLDFIGIDKSRLPLLVPSGTVIGHLTSEAAAALGLETAVEVVAGGHDQYCAALGAGVVEAGDLLVSTGTAWVVLGITAEPILDPRQNFGFGPHVAPGVWGEFGSLRNGGVCLDWARMLLGGSDGDSYDTVEQLTASVTPGAQGLRFFPHFDGTTTPAWNDSAKGTVIGAELRHGRAEFYRAVQEGVCFELRRVIQGYESFGPTISKLRLLGGASNSAVWTQMIADVLGRRVEVPPLAHSACVGAAILAGLGAGVWPDVTRACAAAVPPARVVEPSAHARRYQELFDDYVLSADLVIDLYGHQGADKPL